MDHHEEDDEFFGGDGTEDCGLAGHETKALDAHYQNIGYLEAYDEHKEARLQDGFESGYRETYELSFRLGELLGQLTAKVKLASMITTTTSSGNAERGGEQFMGSEAELRCKSIASRYRDVMDKINRLSDNSSDDMDAVAMLKDLESEVKSVLESIRMP